MEVEAEVEAEEPGRGMPPREAERFFKNEEAAEETEERDDDELEVEGFKLFKLGLEGGGGLKREVEELEIVVEEAGFIEVEMEEVGADFG